mmetsp:Transcript_24618/g.66946  ORF Transcript_24618/g.66946 Transcript_24618/m.66946 type:complete len:426 (-) Transcript_24618:132-1409(-)
MQASHVPDEGGVAHLCRGPDRNELYPLLGCLRGKDGLDAAQQLVHGEGSVHEDEAAAVYAFKVEDVAHDVLRGGGAVAKCVHVLAHRLICRVCGADVLLQKLTHVPNGEERRAQIVHHHTNELGPCRDGRLRLVRAQVLVELLALERPPLGEPIDDEPRGVESEPLAARHLAHVYCGCCEEEGEDGGGVHTHVKEGARGVHALAQEPCGDRGRGDEGGEDEGECLHGHGQGLREDQAEGAQQGEVVARHCLGTRGRGHVTDGGAVERRHAHRAHRHSGDQRAHGYLCGGERHGREVQRKRDHGEDNGARSCDTHHDGGPCGGNGCGVTRERSAHEHEDAHKQNASSEPSSAGEEGSAQGAPAVLRLLIRSAEGPDPRETWWGHGLVRHRPVHHGGHRASGYLHGVKVGAVRPEVFSLRLRERRGL